MQYQLAPICVSCRPVTRGSTRTDPRWPNPVPGRLRALPAQGPQRSQIGHCDISIDHIGLCEAAAFARGWFAFAALARVPVRAGEGI